MRHDVDKRPEQSLVFARLQGELDIRATYYFRIKPESFDPRVIEQISALGHEIGYHYENLSLVEREMKREKGKGNKGKGGRSQQSAVGKEINEYEAELFERGIESFERNLARLRQVADIKTICMHGSPLSKWDSRLLWDRYDYRDYGIIGEPYFDIDFETVAYYTDTGRRWDGEKVSIRDKVFRSMEKGEGRREEKQTKVVRQKSKEGSKGEQENGEGTRENGKEHEEKGERRTENGKERFPRYHSTFEIIDAIERGELPARAMLTFHPQRWTDNAGLWVKELVGQGVKNGVKRRIVRSRE